MHVLTLIAPTHLEPALIAHVASELGAGPPDILSPGEAADLPLDASPDPARVAAALGGAAIDAIAQPSEGRRKRLLVADMDSTIVTSETLDELAALAGVGEQVASITRRSMNGELDFAAALRERVAMLRDLPLTSVETILARTRLTAGAAELVATMRAHGAVTALVSGGFTLFTGPIAARLGFDIHRANTLLHDGSRFTGRVGEPILGREEKVSALRELAQAAGLTSTQTLAVGDGANDLAMLAEAGLGVAFRAKPIVAASARARIDHCGLRALLFAQGYRISEIVQPG